MSVSLKIAALLLTACLMLLGCAARNAPLVKRDSSHYCGHNLVQALQLVCNSAYQTLYSFCLLTDKDVSLTQDSCLVADGLPDAARVCGQECTVGEERLVPLLWSQLGTSSTAGV
ncbi:uncharacterized protein LOC124358052 [Homalodisca vitripennis]|uniref:uncharacterized protein LOC124358052 n=1 Tax=Homalodisca vitripennis TaxID=197043 RepID=UPI001EEC3CF9|nr:uncharacterized protein LOC124358052 [Homalodisca vitripennis]